MGIPNFDGGWSSQPSIWRHACIRQASFAMSLAHVINEMKREIVCPLAVAEIWAYWDPSGSSPKSFKILVEWGLRPSLEPKKATPFMSRELYSELCAESRDFWVACAHERDEGMLTNPFAPIETILSKPNRAFSLLYKDTRVSMIEPHSTRHARLWRARRLTLKKFAGEVSDLLRMMGAACAYEALPMPSQRLTLGELRDAREAGMGLAIESLLNSVLHQRKLDAGNEYEFACREAGATALEMSNAVMCMAYLQGFFCALNESPHWSLVAGSGEQEVFFGLLCRIDPKWGESLDAMQRVHMLRK